MTFIVTEKAMRPASDDRQCFYCHTAIGQHHKEDCVLITKKVKVKMTTFVLVEKPAHWNKEDIEFHMNDSSWCANNILDTLKEQFEEEKCSCMCGDTHFEYIEDVSEPYIDEG